MKSSSLAPPLFLALFFSSLPMITVAHPDANANTSSSSSPPQCPGSAATTHAKCSMSVMFKGVDCSAMRQEIMARVEGKNGWEDPHNRGTYSTRSESPASPSSVAPLLLKRLTTNKSTSFKHVIYTDYFNILFMPSSQAKGCEIEACSESQGHSILDFSTNYCNLHNLFCGEQDGCTTLTIHHNYSYHETLETCAMHDMNACKK